MRGGLRRKARFEGVGGLLGLADQDQGLAEIVGGQGVVRAVGLGLSEGGDGGGVLTSLEFEQPEDEGGRSVVGGLLQSVAVGLDEGVERAAFDMVAVDAIERRAAPGISFEQREEALGGLLFAGLLGCDRIGRLCDRRLTVAEGQADRDSQEAELTGRSEEAGHDAVLMTRDADVRRDDDPGCGSYGCPSVSAG